MKRWNLLRLGLLAAAAVVGAVGTVVPEAAPYTAPAAAFLIGWATRTPGHGPEAPPIVK